MQQLDLPGLESSDRLKSFVKHDKNKTRFDLLDAEFLNFMAIVMTDGAAKYSAENWKLCDEPMQRYYSALQRHLNAFARGERVDPESALSHLYHAACNIMMLAWFEREGTL